MDANVAVVVAFIATIVLGWIPWLGWIAWAVPLVIFFMEKESDFVKRQMVQLLCLAVIRALVMIVVQILLWMLVPAAVIGGAASAVGGGLAFAGLAGLLWLIYGLIGIVITILEVYLVIMAYQWKQVELPTLWPLVEKITARLNGFKAH